MIRFMIFAIEYVTGLSIPISWKASIAWKKCAMPWIVTSILIFIFRSPNTERDPEKNSFETKIGNVRIKPTQEQ